MDSVALTIHALNDNDSESEDYCPKIKRRILRDASNPLEQADTR